MRSSTRKSQTNEQPVPIGSRERRRRRAIAVAYQVFSEEGYEQSGLPEIADVAELLVERQLQVQLTLIDVLSPKLWMDVHLHYYLDPETAPKAREKIPPRDISADALRQGLDRMLRPPVQLMSL